MEFKWKKNVSIVCHLEIGDTVMTDGWGYKLDGQNWKVEDIKLQPGCHSGVLVKINGYENYIDSDWLNKV